MSVKTKVDLIAFTDSNGKKQKKKFELFNSELIRHNVKEWLVLHNAIRNSLDLLTEQQKFNYYRNNLYVPEKMIANWSHVQEDYPFVKFDITEIDEHKDYNPVLPTNILLETNQMSDYDELGITWKQAQIYIDEYLLHNFPKKTDVIEIQQDLTQDQVSELLDKCLSNINYNPTPQENLYSGSSKYPVYSSRWAERKIKEKKKTKDELFNQFEILVMNNAQPTYKLCAFLNPQLHLQPTNIDFNDKDEQTRGKSLSSHIHKLVLDKFKNLFLDWYRKKYLGDNTIEIHIFDNQECFVSDKVRRNITPTKAT